MKYFKKVDHYGTRGLAHALIKSFLYIQQYICLNGYNSNLRTNNYGVSQGSLLDPLLFLLYVNDMSNALQCTPRLFADDTSILLNQSNLATLQDNLNEEVTKLSLLVQCK